MPNKFPRRSNSGWPKIDSRNPCTFCYIRSRRRKSTPSALWQIERRLLARRGGLRRHVTVCSWGLRPRLLCSHRPASQRPATAVCESASCIYERKVLGFCSATWRADAGISERFVPTTAQTNDFCTRYMGPLSGVRNLSPTHATSSEHAAQARGFQNLAESPAPRAFCACDLKSVERKSRSKRYARDQHARPSPLLARSRR